MSNGKEEKVDQKRGIRIDWSNVVTTAISTLVAAVFVGAAVIVWKASYEQDKRIREIVSAASTNLLLADIKQDEAQKALTEELGALRTAFEGQRAELARLTALFTNRFATSTVAGVVGVLSEKSPSWDEYVFRGRTNARNLNLQIQQQVQQRWNPQLQNGQQQK